MSKLKKRTFKVEFTYSFETEKAQVSTERRLASEEIPTMAFLGDEGIKVGKITVTEVK